METEDAMTDTEGLCCACGEECEGQLCEDCYELGRTCGMHGEMEE